MSSSNLQSAVIVNNLDELLQALAAKSALITTPPNAIFYMGLLYIEQMLEIAAKTYPKVYDSFLLNTQDNSAICHLALKGKIKNILFTGSNRMYFKLKNLADNDQIKLSLSN